MVSNLLVGIVIYIFDLFHSALIYISHENHSRFPRELKIDAARATGCELSWCSAAVTRQCLVNAWKAAQVHTCGVWKSNSAVQHVGNRKWSGWPLAFALTDQQNWPSANTSIKQNVPCFPCLDRLWRKSMAFM